MRQQLGAKIRHRCGDSEKGILGSTAQMARLPVRRDRNTKPQRGSYRFRDGRDMPADLVREATVSRRLRLSETVTIAVENLQVHAPCHIGDRLASDERRKATGGIMHFGRRTKDLCIVPAAAVFAVEFAARLSKWTTRRQARRALRQLEDWQLSDVGLTPREAETEASKVFWKA